jgi:hypothetical protein
MKCTRMRNETDAEAYAVEVEEVEVPQMIETTINSRRMMS